MAKWGEGDPRWIVEERPDATNVNNWHWVEKNATSWSIDKLKELLTGLVVENKKGSCEVKELTKVEGEATANNRKGKLIFFYEFEVKGKWSGCLKDSKKSYKGTFDIPNLSEENEAHEIDVNVSCDSTSDDATEVKEIMRIVGTKVIQEKMAEYINRLREEYGQGIILPTKDCAKAPAPKVVNKENKAKEEMNKVVTDCSERMDGLGVRIHTKKLVTREEFKCRAADLYRALTDKGMVEAFTGGPATLEPAKGERFSMMGGHVTGEFVDLVPEKKIVQKWRIKSWPTEHYSFVTIELEEQDSTTVLRLTQQGVPDSEYDNTLQGWKTHYWQRMNQVFGFSANLF
ncbi:activator of 90 kDa heat shock protein ATPase homolog 1-like [Haliotis rufescens]|uniref:activator of 90 kDa heat shock protein ATPase homolog 1-like n=1 Tax=Haliotis rufescens TaxID=6454 RepID=UPI00201E9E63|nr:activator of 90 kDa heat shock protein ATPase homolog 1-like [Haliotis rufescens]